MTARLVNYKYRSCRLLRSKNSQKKTVSPTDSTPDVSCPSCKMLSDWPWTVTPETLVRGKRQTDANADLSWHSDLVRHRTLVPRGFCSSVQIAVSCNSVSWQLSMSTLCSGLCTRWLTVCLLWILIDGYFLNSANISRKSLCSKWFLYFLVCGIFKISRESHVVLFITEFYDYGYC